MASRTDMRQLTVLARKRGWQIETTPGNHLRLTHPRGGLVFAPTTPSDHRGLKNLMAELRRQERRWSA
jgi:predicted RNA binding protein YcfA (HicA-like mRNA interferase family)